MEDVWVDSWYAVTDEHTRKILEDELRKEVGPEHPLWNKRLQLIARRDGSDDALFSFDDGRIAEVHLTWTGKPECHPWPGTRIFAGLDQWRAANPADDGT